MTHSRPGSTGPNPEPLHPADPPAPGQNPSAPEAGTLTDGSSAHKTGGGLNHKGAHGFRRPVPPFPIERYDLVHPAVPRELEGLSILHVTDLHVRKGRPFLPHTRRAIEALAATPADLVLFTGDYMNYPGDEPATLIALREVVAACRASLGVYGIFGNHDSWELRRDARAIPGIAWLADSRGVAHPLAGLRLVGADEPEDLLGVLTAASLAAAEPRPFTLALVHYPTEVLVGADFNLPLLLAGHTHGGQFRATRRLAPHTSCDLPSDLASGILRVRQTLCCVSRGLGNAVVELRINCPPQIPLYVLRHGPLPAISAADHERISVHTGW